MRKRSENIRMYNTNMAWVCPQFFVMCVITPSSWLLSTENPRVVLSATCTRLRTFSGNTREGERRSSWGGAFLFLIDEELTWALSFIEPLSPDVTHSVEFLWGEQSDTACVQTPPCRAVWGPDFPRSQRMSWQEGMENMSVKVCPFLSRSLLLSLSPSFPSFCLSLSFA